MITSFKGKYEFLSNFYPCKIVYEGVRYPSVENAFQAAKTFNLSERKYLAFTDDMSEAKRYGRHVKLREDWENVKLLVMKELLRIKFSYSDLKELLLSTGNEILIEGNTWNDTYWGSCKGVGENHLGELLMEIREELKHEDSF